MDIYLVGGAVRDELLGRPVVERDWVVVGATPEDMVAKGFKPVGRDFPVFLHPKTYEEYALARTERKVGRGYRGFQIFADPSVTLEDDLERRDLTINAIARTEKGQVIDPFNGQRDLYDRKLRHVSEAFIEDPVRILRVARFTARYAHLGFTVADETMHLMQRMVELGEVDALVAERVWQEWHSALGEEHPGLFFDVLKSAHAFERLFPELVTDYDERLQVLQQACVLTPDPRVRFAAQIQEAAEHLDQRYRLPREFRDLALLVGRLKTMSHCALQYPAQDILTILEKTDAYRRPERLNDFLLACAADYCAGHHEIVYPQAKHIEKIFEIAKSVSIRDCIDAGLTGPFLKEELHRRRVLAVAKLD